MKKVFVLFVRFVFEIKKAYEMSLQMRGGGTRRRKRPHPHPMDEAPLRPPRHPGLPATGQVPAATRTTVARHRVLHRPVTQCSMPKKRNAVCPINATPYAQKRKKRRCVSRQLTLRLFPAHAPAGGVRRSVSQTFLHPICTHSIRKLLLTVVKSRR